MRLFHSITAAAAVALFPVAEAVAKPAANPGAKTGGFTMILFIIVIIGAMYFMMIRPQQKRQKQHRAMVEALAKGDEVVTNGGVAGRIDHIGESFVTVEIATNVKIKLQRTSIAQVLPKGTLKSA